jgi:hypothetical protein
MARARGRFGTAGPDRQRRGVLAALTAAALGVPGDFAPSDSIKCRDNRGGTPYLCHSHAFPHFIFLCVTRFVLTDKRRIHLRSASVQTYTFFTTGFPRFLSIRGARGLQAFDLPLLTNYSNPNYD